MKAGRNAPCACGSGKKYKHCCAHEDSRRVGAATLPGFGELGAMANSARFAEMENAALGILAVKPQSGLAWKALSVAQQMQGKHALPALQRAAEALPSDPEVHNNLGAAQRRAGRLADAVASFRRAIALNANFAEVHNNLGNALNDLGRLDDAVQAFRRALQLKPDFAKALCNLAGVLQDQGKLEEAAACYRQAIASQPTYAEAHTGMAILQRLQSRPGEAEGSCRRALELNANLTAAVTLFAELLADRGEFATSEQQFLRAIALEPESAEAWAGLAGLRRMTSGDAGWLEKAQQLAARSLPRQEIYLRYAIGKYFDDVGNFSEAFASYRRANELTQMLRPVYDRQQMSRAIDQIVASFGEDWVSRMRVECNGSESPVLVVGMPRSGTTLVEQILAAHRDVYGAGELPFWATEMTAAAARDGGEIDQEKLRGAADRYLKVLHDLAPGALRVVDKMPANFLYLGIVHAALPRARIIHLRRHPIDTCLSIYFQNFGAVHSYANDLSDLAHYYREYARLMDHWRVTLPAGTMLEVSYEKLVANPEFWSRKIVDFIGLPWDAKCLDFHLTSRTVSTFSKWQARQRISRTSVERWRHYEEFLAPLSGLIEITEPP
jgi:tetratricopeptide (TPR) repeat protein